MDTRTAIVIGVATSFGVLILGVPIVWYATRRLDRLAEKRSEFIDGLRTEASHLAGQSMSAHLWLREQIARRERIAFALIASGGAGMLVAPTAITLDLAIGAVTLGGASGLIALALYMLRSNRPMTDADWSAIESRLEEEAMSTPTMVQLRQEMAEIDRKLKEVRRRRGDTE